MFNFCWVCILTLHGLASALSIEKFQKANFALLFKSECIALHTELLTLITEMASIDILQECQKRKKKRMK